MDIVKLHATRSTNEELRSRFRESELKHLSTIYALHQTHGKGQQQTTWESEPFKNLLFSVLVSETEQFTNTFQLNKIVSVAIVEWLEQHLKIQARIKWPNDILSVKHKLAGILIENIYSGTHHSHSIVGIGLNVNQKEFKQAPKAVSLSILTGKTYPLESLLISFLTHLEKALEQPQYTAERYHQHLFKYQQVTEFIDKNGPFKAQVIGTDESGRLILDRDGSQIPYDLKELRWKY